MTQTVYIAGPMTGIKQWNFPAFFNAEARLTELGYIAINPARNDGDTVRKAVAAAGPIDAPNNTWESYIRRDLPHVLKSDVVCVLPGWQNSRGAVLEVHVARSIGIPLMILSDEGLVPRVTAIGLSAYAQSGKDTVADRLVEKHGYTKMSFAAPIREALVRLNPRINMVGMPPGAQLSTFVRISGWEELKADEVGDVRGLLQRMGTEVGREMFGEDVWADYAINSIPDGAKVVFADVRYPNEADAIRNLGGSIWRIVRKGVGPANDHTSESAMDSYEFDAVLKNSHGVDFLGIKVDYLVKAG